MEGVRLHSPFSKGMKQKTRDNLIYLGVAIAIVAAFTGYGIYAVKTTGEAPDIPGPILWGILSTPGIVALILERFWRYRHRRSLWVICIVAAAINVSAMFIAYSLRWNPPVIVWSVMTVLWVIFVFVVTEKFVIRDPGG
jgi:peptidoglycan/LPS O-acetylase OafA/YrhL